VITADKPADHKFRLHRLAARRISRIVIILPPDRRAVRRPVLYLLDEESRWGGAVLQ
jgi:enterochelin esterase-like enzyme